MQVQGNHFFPIVFQKVFQKLKIPPRNIPEEVCASRAVSYGVHINTACHLARLWVVGQQWPCAQTSLCSLPQMKTY